MVLSAELALIMAAYVAAGLFTGLMAGLLGLGGGLVMIPVLNALFARQGVAPEVIQHLALGTSLAAILPGSLLSARGHSAHGAVEWAIVVRRMAPGIVLGSLVAAPLTRFLSTGFLQGLYLLLCLWVLVSLFLRADGVSGTQAQPLRAVNAVAGGIGLASGLLGIGGGSLSTPYLLWHGRDIRTAIGSAAALGVPIAVAGTLAYVLAGAGVPGRPPTALGFVDGLAVAGLVLGSSVSIPWGVALAHRLPRLILKRLFVLMIVLAAAKMALHMAGIG